MPRYQDSGLHDSSEHSSEEIPAKKKKVITKKRISCEKEESKSNSRTNQKSKSKSDKISSKNSSDDQEEITAASNRLKILNIDDQLSETTEPSKIKFCIEWLNPESQIFKPWAAKANDCEHVYDKFCDKTYKINSLYGKKAICKHQKNILKNN